MYALKTKGKFEFSCRSKTVSELDEKIQRYYATWAGMQARGSDKTFDDFMTDKEKVKLTIEKI